MSGPGGPYPGSLILTPQERLAQAQKKMENGTGGGRWKIAQPVVPRRPTGTRGRAAILATAHSGCVIDHFPGTGPGVYDPGSGYGIQGADLDWAPDISEATSLHGLRIVDGQVAAWHSAYNDTIQGGGGGIVGPTDPISGDVEAKLTASEFSGFVDNISGTTYIPGVTPQLYVYYMLKARMIGDGAYYLVFSKGTGYVDENRGPGWRVNCGATFADIAGHVDFLGPDPTYPFPANELAIPSINEGDVLALRVVGQFPTIVTGTVNGSAIFEVNSDTVHDWGTIGQTGTPADLPFGAYGGFDIFTYAGTGDAGSVYIVPYDDMVRGDDFSLCPV